MNDDVEMNEVKSPLLDNDLTKEYNVDVIPEVDFIKPKVKEDFSGLSKDELEKYAKDPFWKKLRLVLFILFWLIWLAMLIAAILIVVFSPKCPKIEKLEFWQKKVGYMVDTMAFVDSDNNNVGDFEGLIKNLNYIQNIVGAGYIVLDNIFYGQYSNTKDRIGEIMSFREIDPILGKKESFVKLIKESRKRGIEIVMTADFNSLSSSSVFIKNNSDRITKWNKGMENWVSRDGLSSKRNFNKSEFYSSSQISSTMVDLNLTNKDVLTEIQESIKMWLDLGVRGFLLTNVAFYTENVTNINITRNFFSNVSKWYNQKEYCKMFCEGTVEFLREIRKSMSAVAKKTDKSRLLIVEAGNIGFGLTDVTEKDEMLQYLRGSEDLVDMIVSREFLRNRGWSISTSYEDSFIENYLNMSKTYNRKKIALMSATSTSLRTSVLKKMAAPFLLPGNPIIYYGSEIGNECDGNIMNKLNFYPQSHKFALEDISGEFPIKCNHMVMPWDNSGKGFKDGNSNSMEPYLISLNSTVQGLSAIGRGETIFQLHRKLIKVREEPSLQWGSISMILNDRTKNGICEIFVREADGFPKIIVSLIKDKIKGKVVSLSDVCSKVIPLLVYPENLYLPENKEVDASSIYLKNGEEESVHVFKCVP